MKCWAVRSVMTDKAGVRIEVESERVSVHSVPISELAIRVADIRQQAVTVDLSEDEALDLLAWLRRWEAE
jgi:hypothetical protein